MRVRWLWIQVCFYRLFVGVFRHAENPRVQYDLSLVYLLDFHDWFLLRSPGSYMRPRVYKARDTTTASRRLLVVIVNLICVLFKWIVCVLFSVLDLVLSSLGFSLFH